MKTKDLTKIALFVAIITVCSYIAIPMTVSFTLQTFAIFLACFLLGWKNATIAVAVYILLGAAGVPVFTGFKSGFGALLGPTGGYIIGFLAQCLVYGAIVAVFKDKPVIKLAASVAGLITLYTFGTLWFYFGYTVGGTESLITVLLKCVIPFILPDLAKLTLAYVVAESLKKSHISA